MLARQRFTDFTIGFPLSLVAFLGTVRVLSACDCVSPPVAQAYRNADAVFVGVVTSIESQAQGSFRREKTRFRIAMAWRGVVDRAVDVWNSGTSCDYGFKVGEIYLVFARWDSFSNRLRTAVCTRTAPIITALDAPIHVAI